MTDKNEKVTEKNEIAEKKNTALASASIFEEDAGGGLENITAEDLTIPRLKILQALSPEVSKADGKYIEGAEAGDITNTVTGQVFPSTEGCIVIPVLYKRMFLEWQPRESGGGLISQHTDPDILSKTTKDKQGADVLENGNYIQTSATHYVLTVDGDSFQQVMIPMAGTQLKKSRTWNSLMASLKVKSGNGNVFTPPSYSHKYRLTTVPESNDRGSWYGWVIENLGVLGEGEMHLYDAAKQFASTVNFDNTSGFSTDPSEAPF
jgi:hypothetical protein|tara:strand:- start:302 stop:1090 length:789 start_codon:yes stop_codon:yes gene_type:complete